MTPRQSGQCSIAEFTTVVAVFAAGLAALSRPNELWAGTFFLLMIALSLTATIGAFRSRMHMGYAVFSWVYIFLAFFPWDDHRHRLPHLLPALLLESLRVSAGGDMAPPARQSYIQISNCVGAIFFGGIGGAIQILARKRVR